MIRWGEPALLAWLPALLPLAALLVFLALHRERRLRLLLDGAALARLAPGRRRGRILAGVALRLVACALVLLALARPQWGIRWQQERRRGLDVLVLLDTSNSMRATDLRPSRFERARRGVSDLLARLEGDRVGLVPFAGSSYLACPLTADRAAFAMMLDDVRPGSVPRGGTALAQALETALASFGPASAGADRAIVLVSDGEDHVGGLERAIGALVRERVRVFAIGVGTAAGEAIPAATPGSPFLRDRAGEVVRTALRQETLERIAVATGGMYAGSAADDAGWDRAVVRGIATLKRDEQVSKLVKVNEERFPWFLGAALLALGGEALLSGQRRVKREDRP